LSQSLLISPLLRFACASCLLGSPLLPRSAFFSSGMPLSHF
jgi:hypothetical protein